MAAKSVLFDLDGTLWDSYPWYARLLEQAGGLSHANAFRRLQARESFVKLMRECGLGLGPFRQACRELQLFPGALDALERLQRKGLPLGIVTSLPERLAVPMLEALGIERRFQIAMYAARKPNPRSILDAIRHIGLAPGGAIFYVGDQATDAEAAKSAGISFAWAEYGYGDGKPAATDIILASAADIGRL